MCQVEVDGVSISYGTFCDTYLIPTLHFSILSPSFSVPGGAGWGVGPRCGQPGYLQGDRGKQLGLLHQGRRTSCMGVGLFFLVPLLGAKMLTRQSWGAFNLLWGVKLLTFCGV